MSKPPKLNRSERVAQHVLETVIAGSRVEHRWPQSNGEYDVDWYLPDGTKAAVEVTSVTDEQSLGTLASMAKKRIPIDARMCRQSWIVLPGVDARINDIVQKLDQYLSAIEHDGISEFYARDSLATPSVSGIAKELAIVEGHVLQMPPPPRIWLGGPSDGNGSMVNAHDLQRAVEAVANKKDNKCKLVASGCAETHLFVHVDSLSCHAWNAMVWGEIPSAAPRLPAEITHIWAAAQVEAGIVVWTAGLSRGWQDRGLIAPIP